MLACGGVICESIQTLSSHGSGPNPVQAGPHAYSALVRGSTVPSADLGADRVHAHAIEHGTLVRTLSVSLPRAPGLAIGSRNRVAQSGQTLLFGELRGTLFALDDRGQVAAAGRSPKGTIAADWVDGDHAAGLAAGSPADVASPTLLLPLL